MTTLSLSLAGLRPAVGHVHPPLAPCSWMNMVYGLALCGGALSLNADSVLDQSELTLHKVVFCLF